ncbi:ATP-binding protein, partial [Candidatus Pacearchaeota archaeon]|nr:ATP-binding protein [Candidatus Pacearchaeota archaeon]
VLAERLGNIIERKLAIQKAYMHQLETAHASRVNSIGEMASSLAHEINHPLFVMQAQAERSAKLLESGSQNIDNVIDKMQIIIKQADRAQKIISRIRGFVRKGKSETQKVFLNELINNSLDLLQIEMENKKIKFQLDLSIDGLKVNTDPVQIEQVIVNLINNSIDALDGNPENDRQISIKSSMLQGNAEVRIKDNGSGMSPKEMQIVFDSFYTTKSNGLGMGLSISRSIIESQGGRIGLEFNADKGITSYFTLPVKKTS